MKKIEPKQKKIAATPTTERWGMSENNAFKMLYAKCPTLTKEYIEKIATAQNKSIYGVLSIMLIANVQKGKFELDLS